MNVTELEAGPEMDERVCAALGIRHQYTMYYAQAPGRPGAGWFFDDHRSEVERVIADHNERMPQSWTAGSVVVESRRYPEVSTDWGAAGLVVEKMRADGWDFRLVNAYPNGWVAEFFRASTFRFVDYPGAWAETAPHAIVKAALAALGIPNRYRAMKVKIILPERDTDALSEAMRAITRAIEDSGGDISHGVLGGSDGYGGHFDGLTFMMRPYCWCERDDCPWCGGCQADHDEPAHAPDCYQSRVDARVSEWERENDFAAIDRRAFGRDGPTLMGMFNGETESPAPGVTVWSGEPRRDDAMEEWSKAYDKRRKVEDRARRELCKEMSLSYPSRCAVHCTCGASDDYRKRREACRCDYCLPAGVFAAAGAEPGEGAPNFWHKPSGLKVWWYKYIGRGMEVVNPSSVSVTDVLRECLSEISAKPFTSVRQ